MNKQTERVFERYQRAPRTVSEGQHIYGDPDSRFTLMQFSDLECPYCKKFHKTPLEVVDESDGLVNLPAVHGVYTSIVVKKLISTNPVNYAD